MRTSQNAKLDHRALSVLWSVEKILKNDYIAKDAHTKQRRPRRHQETHSDVGRPLLNIISPLLMLLLLRLGPLHHFTDDDGGATSISPPIKWVPVPGRQPGASDLSGKAEKEEVWWME